MASAFDKIRARRRIRVRLGERTERRDADGAAAKKAARSSPRNAPEPIDRKRA
jgi:hypothetical protein